MAYGGIFPVSPHKASLDGAGSMLECRVCDDTYRLHGDKVPRLLHCGHTVCHQCLTRLPVQQQNAVLCPFDRQPTLLEDSGIWSLKKNFALLELLEKLQFPASMSVGWSPEILEKEKEFAIQCDENEEHTAVLYCTTCSTHLCVLCSELTHSTRTLARHKMVPLSEKPKEYPKCNYHPMHLVEFTCLEEDCQVNPLMCYICKDYGRHLRHRHSLLETEAQTVKAAILSAIQQCRTFAEEVRESSRHLVSSIQQTEGGAFQDDQQSATGTADEARQRVKQYFHKLRETLQRQEVVALTVVDTHIREKLCMLKQYYEDTTILMSQISVVCHQCERSLQQDDTKVILAKQEVKTLVDTVQKQQQQFAELRDHQLYLDPNIPITFTKDNRVHIGPKMEMRVVTLGLDDSGKTSILCRLKQDEFIQTIPTIGFNVETVEYKNLKFTIWDVGGLHKLRPLWRHYYLNTQALIYVVDSSDRTRISESHNELVKLLQEKELQEASLLLFANKQDAEGCMSIEEISDHFNLFKLCCARSWHIQGCDAKTSTGLHDGLEWLSRQLVAATHGNPS